MDAREQRLVDAAVAAGTKNGADFFEYVVRTAALKPDEQDIWPILLKLRDDGVIDIWTNGTINRFETPDAPREETKVRISKLR